MKSMMVAVIVGLATLSARAEEPKKIKLAVMQLGASPSMPKELVSSLTNALSESLEKIGAFEAISSEDIARILTYESQQQLLGCNETECLSELGGALGVDYLVSGALTQSGRDYVLQLQITDAHGARVEGRTSRNYSGETSGLFGEIDAGAKALTRGILEKSGGKLIALVSEEGATVRLDGRIIGTSPLEPVDVGAGYHELVVEKEGFVTAKQDVQVHPEHHTTISVRLVPSADFAEQYKARAGFTRLLAYGSGGVGAAALVAGVVTFFIAGQKADALNEDVTAYNAGVARPTTSFDGLASRERSIAMLDTVTLTAAGVGVLGLAVGAFLYVTGDDPDRYEASPEVSVGPKSVSLSVPW